MLTLTEVTKTFTQGSEEIQTLVPTTLHAEPGEFVAILGPSGSGKSTMLTIIGGLQKPTSGHVEIDGIDITDSSVAELSKLRLDKLGFILQSSSLVPFLSVRDQLALHAKVAGKPYDSERGDALLERLGLTKVAKKHPENLSGGERQRVAIAASLIHDPVIILADEPTAALDTERAFQTVELLRDLTHEDKQVTIMVSHDERLTSYCDAAYRMRDGHLSKDEAHTPGEQAASIGEEPACGFVRRLLARLGL